MTTGLGGKVMTYDAENRTKTARLGGVTTTYVYGADGARLKRTVGGLATVTVGPVEVRGYGSGSETLLTYPQPEVRLSGGQAAYLHRDQVGSIALVTDAAGADGEHATYQPFGEARDIVAGTIPAETRGFVGERYDAAPELQYLNARYYDPDLSLFTSPDWLEVTDPGVGTNRHAYAGNSPVNQADPGGNCPSCVAAGFGALAGLATQFVSDVIDVSQGGDWSSPRAYAASAGTGALIFATGGLAAPEALGARVAIGAATGEAATVVHSIASGNGMPSVADQFLGMGLGGLLGAVAPPPARPSVSTSPAVGAVKEADSIVPEIGYTRGSLQHGFKHTEDFGVTGNANMSFRGPRTSCPLWSTTLPGDTPLKSNLIHYPHGKEDELIAYVPAGREAIRETLSHLTALGV